jgi:hypothetical protein
MGGGGRGPTRSLRKLETVLKDRMAVLALKIPLRPLDVPVKAQSIGSTVFVPSIQQTAEAFPPCTFPKSNASSLVYYNVRISVHPNELIASLTEPPIQRRLRRYWPQQLVLIVVLVCKF